MNVKWKVGQFESGPISTWPGDTFRLTYNDPCCKQTILHEELITRADTYTHYGVLATPAGNGMFVGTEDLETWFESTFPGCRVVEGETIL